MFMKLLLYARHCARPPFYLKMNNLALELKEMYRLLHQASEKALPALSGYLTVTLTQKKRILLITGSNTNKI